VTKDASSAYSLGGTTIALRLAPCAVVTSVEIISSGTYNSWGATLLIFEEYVASFASFAS